MDRVVSDAGQHVAQVKLWVETVEFGGANQAVDRGGAFAAGVGAREQVVLSAQSDGAQGAFGGIMPRAGLCRVRADWVRHAAYLSSVQTPPSCGARFFVA